MKKINTMRSLVLWLGLACGVFGQTAERKPLTPAQRRSIEAVSNGDRFALKKEIDAGVDLNLPSPDYISVLLIAMQEKQSSLIPLLIEGGADTKWKHTDNRTLMHFTVAQKDITAAKHLVEGGAPVDQPGGKNPDGADQNMTPLSSAALNGLLDHVKLFAENGANLNHVDAFNGTPLYRAWEKKHESVARYLENLGATDNPDDAKKNPLVSKGTPSPPPSSGNDSGFAARGDANADSDTRSRSAPRPNTAEDDDPPATEGGGSGLFGSSADEPPIPPRAAREIREVRVDTVLGGNLSNLWSAFQAKHPDLQLNEKGHVMAVGEGVTVTGGSRIDSLPADWAAELYELGVKEGKVPSNPEADYLVAPRGGIAKIAAEEEKIRRAEAEAATEERDTAKAEEEAKKKAAEDKAEAERKAEEDEQAAAQKEADDRAAAEKAEADAKAEAEAKAKAEEEARNAANAEEKAKAEAAAAAARAKAKAAEEARKAEEKRKAKEAADALAAQQAEEEAAAKAAEAKRKAEEAAARAASKEEADRIREEAKAEAARKKAEEAAARAAAKEEADRLAAEEAARIAAAKSAEEAARLQAEADARAASKAEEEKRIAAAKAAEEARNKAAADAEAKRKAEEEARRLADDAARRKLEEEAATKAAAEAAKKAKEEKYANLIAQGKSAFAGRNYEDAKAKYQEALKIKPTEVFPQAQIEKIDKILAAIAKRETAAPKPKETPKTPAATGGEAEPKDALAREYGEGVHETVDNQGSKTVTTRIVVRNGEGHTYKFVKHNWGGRYFFKDDKPITEIVWDKETKK